MTFVTELISEEDKKKIDFNAIKVPIYNRPVDPYSWTIDRERDVFLMWILPGGEDERRAAYYVLWWKGTIIHMKLERVFVENICTWRILQLNIPESLQNERGEIIQILKEALEVFPLFYGQQHLSQARFEF